MFSIIQYVILETCYNDIFTDCLGHLLSPPQQRVKVEHCSK